MPDTDLFTRYPVVCPAGNRRASGNYDEFVPTKFEPWMRFDFSPPLGGPAPDFPLWHLDGSETSLAAIWSHHTYTLVEFGSFT